MKNNYHCKACGKTVKRESEKAWIKSICADTGKDVRITRVFDIRRDSRKPTACPS
jgi:ribosomal protein L37AE/L43A